MQKNHYFVDKKCDFVDFEVVQLSHLNLLVVVQSLDNLAFEDSQHEIAQVYS